MKIIIGLIALALLASRGSSAPGPAPDDKNEKVHSFFENMEKGEYRESKFPDLGMSDIPALLQRADRTNLLKTFPRNPASSQYEPTCSEGMVALWLVEGIRQGGKYPSLSALCFKGPVRGNDWTKASEENHAEVARAYRSWWEKAQKLAIADVTKLDPLKETGMAWH